MRVLYTETTTRRWLIELPDNVGIPSNENLSHDDVATLKLYKQGKEASTMTRHKILTDKELENVENLVDLEPTILDQIMPSHHSAHFDTDESWIDLTSPEDARKFYAKMEGDD
jgi:hypothetical protein